ncbi:serine/threonine protein kinase [Thermosporothrix hazakensis]|uniref:non-specific serine/threonine protein kinase n=2 Tax=Thermosporothrix TaxID=768650 RepID=A0A326UE32_THEHA|nr:serine/threonine-protein kinase [Thermosporothrix hazakensis]PZW36697.1 serine/threonine protein kinase [Thermosporothrix hazakensis]BBH89165.1 hypothetical protein KTC_39160 [Thermosporothrix sp. COM3]GCE47348.1 hypothetical protein KTH_22170 [Thermosporothrix hazakensis]
MSSNVQQIGKYRLLESLGKGGTSETWKAFDGQKRQHVIVKQLQAEVDNPTAFVQTTDILKALYHPNVIPLREGILENAGAYMVREFVTGKTLAHILQQKRQARETFSAQEIVEIFYPVAQAVEYAHRSRIIHGGLKPSNIFLRQPDGRGGSYSGEVVVTDFGAWQLLGNPANAQHRLSLTAMTYISPEQAWGNPGRPSSDIYALGVILYEICAGTVPFQGNRPVALLMQHANKAPVPLRAINPHISERLEAVIMNCLEKDASRRFQSAPELVSALADALQVPLPENTTPSLSGKQTSGWLQSVPRVIDATPAPKRPEQQPARTVASDVRSQSGLPADHRRNENVSQKSDQVQALSEMLASRQERQRRQQKLIVTVSALLALTLVLGIVLTLTLTLSMRSEPKVLGYASFSSSHLFEVKKDGRGNNDQMTVTLSNLEKQPAAGSSFYAWLLPDKGMSLASALLLGKLQLGDDGKATLFYQDKQQTNLFLRMSRLVVTEEPDPSPPQKLTTDTSKWRYYAEMPQSVGNDKTLLQQMRALLVQSPELKTYGIEAGLSGQMLQNMQNLFALSTHIYSVQLDGTQATSWDPTSLRQELAKLLIYLEGYEQGTKDASPISVTLSESEKQATQLGLVSGSKNYLGLLEQHLENMRQSPNLLQEHQEKLSTLRQEVKVQRQWLMQILNDAKQAVKMSDKQLTSTGVFVDIARYGSYAYTGCVEEKNNQKQPGFVEIYVQTQDLAALPLLSYAAGSEK